MEFETSSHLGSAEEQDNIVLYNQIEKRFFFPQQKEIKVIIEQNGYQAPYTKENKLTQQLITQGGTL